MDEALEFFEDKIKNDPRINILFETPNALRQFVMLHKKYFLFAFNEPISKDWSDPTLIAGALKGKATENHISALVSVLFSSLAEMYVEKNEIDALTHCYEQVGQAIFG